MTLKINIEFLLLGALGLLLTGCSSVTVKTEYNPKAKFAQYRTYTLSTSKEGLALSPPSEEALRGSLRTNLFSRGLTEISLDQADLEIVSRVLSKDQEISVEQYKSWPSYSGRRGVLATPPRAYTEVHQYKVGTLLLDFEDTKTHELVFRGVAQGTVGSAKTNAKNITEAVKKIVRDFPVGDRQRISAD